MCVMYKSHFDILFTKISVVLIQKCLHNVFKIAQSYVKCNVVWFKISIQFIEVKAGSASTINIFIDTFPI